MFRAAFFTIPALTGLALTIAACSPSSQNEAAVDTATNATRSDMAATAPDVRETPETSTQAETGSTFAARLSAIDVAVKQWENAGTIAAAHRAAETARNLVVGPNGPYYGDGDKDGTIAGANTEGLLPGLAGQSGLASANPNACVERDVLGGSWADPARRWNTAKTAITDWSKTNNTFPSLPSHPQRIVGWSTLTLASDDLATAREYGGHARIHIDVASKAASNCKSG